MTKILKEDLFSDLNYCCDAFKQIPVPIPLLVVRLDTSQPQDLIRHHRLLKRFCAVLGADLSISHWLLLCDTDVAGYQLAMSTHNRYEGLTSEASE